jgi:copper chaperone CopZ
MTGSCAKTIQEDLTQLEGEKATVDFETKIVTFDNDKTVKSRKLQLL